MTDSRSTPMEVRVPLAEFKSLIEGAVSAIYYQYGPKEDMLRTIARCLLNEDCWPRDDATAREEAALQYLAAALVYETDIHPYGWASSCKWALENVRLGNKCSPRPSSDPLYVEYQTLLSSPLPTCLFELADLLNLTSKCASNEEARKIAVSLSFAYCRTRAELV